MKRLFFLLSGIAFVSTLIYGQSLSIYCEDEKPLQFVGQDGQLTGMSVELVQEIQKRVGNLDPIQMVPWARGYHEIQERSDVVLFTTNRTAQRDDLFHWIGPIYESAFGFYVRADSTIKINSLEDAKKVTSIGVYLDDVRDQLLTQAGFTNLDRANDNYVNFKKLMKGRIEVFASSATDIEENAIAAGYKATDAKLLYVFNRSQAFIAMSKKMPGEIVTSWKTALNDMKKDGTFKKIFNKYYPNRELPGPEITTF